MTRDAVTTGSGAIHLAPTLRGQHAGRGIPATTAGTAKAPVVEPTVTVRWTSLCHQVLLLMLPIKSVHFTNHIHTLCQHDLCFQAYMHFLDFNLDEPDVLILFSIILFQPSRTRFSVNV